MTMGEKICQYMDYEGLTIKDFCIRVGHPRLRLYPYLYGYYYPHVKICIDIANVMGISVEDLINGKKDWIHYYEAEHGVIIKK